MKNRRNTAADRVYLALRDAILSWELKPREPLFEDDVAEKYKVSRTPVREALRLLSTEDLVRFTPGRGAYVTEVSIKTITDVYQIIQNLESLAAQLTAEQRHLPREFDELARQFENATNLILENRFDEYHALTRRMYNLIATTAGNEHLTRMLENLWQQALRFRRLSYTNSERLLQTVTEHKLILQAILDHDGPKAADLVKRHIQASLATYLAFHGLRGMD